MCVCMCMSVCVHVYVYVYVHVHVHVCVCMYATCIYVICARTGPFVVPIYYVYVGYHTICVYTCALLFTCLGFPGGKLYIHIDRWMDRWMGR